MGIGLNIHCTRPRGYHRNVVVLNVTYSIYSFSIAALPICDNSLNIWRSFYYGMTSGVSFGVVLSIGAVLFVIWPNILPLQQHFAMAQIIPGATRAPTFGSAPANTTAAHAANTTTAGAPANTTAAHAANTTTAGAPDPGDPAGEEVVPPWFGGTPCHDEIESNCAK